MAKQNSAPDPVSAAMSAIESALNLTDDDSLATNDSPLPGAHLRGEARIRDAGAQTGGA